MVFEKIFRKKNCYFLKTLICLCFFQGLVQAQAHLPSSEDKTTPAGTHQTLDVSSESPTPASEHLRASALTPDTENPKTPVTDSENLIHLGDLIDVDVVGSTEYDWRGKLTPEGFFSGINFIDEPIYGLCKTETAVAAAIAKGYSKLLNDPQVVVKIIDRAGRPVSLLYGAVKSPQRFQIQRRIRLNELLVLSGGITEKASGEIQILRPPSLGCEIEQNRDAGQTDNLKHEEKFVAAKQEKESQYINIKISDLIKGETGSNPVILSGDVVTVLEAQPIYVIGGVANPKQINAHSKITLSRAIATAGGFTKDADPKKITVFRKEKDGTKTIEVDYEKIKANADEDLILQAFDIIEVTKNGRERNKFVPVISNAENKPENFVEPPLRIID